MLERFDDKRLDFITGAFKKRDAEQLELERKGAAAFIAMLCLLPVLAAGLWAALTELAK